MQNKLVVGIMGNLTFHWVTGAWTQLIEQVTALGTGQEQEQEAGAGGRRQEQEQEQGGLARGLQEDLK